MCRHIKKKLNNEVEVHPITSIETVKTEENLSILFDYDDLKQGLLSEPIDYLKLHELQIRIGELGEALVYKEEYKKLKGTKYAPKIDQSKALDPTNGYDILSYKIDGTPLHIEVKTTTGNISSFYLSNHELETAKRMKKEGLIYVVYFIKEIMSNNPYITVIEDISKNPSYLFQELSWKVTERENL